MNQLLISGQRRRTADDINGRASRAAAGLQSLGVGKGDCVALLLRNDFAFFEAMLASSMVGAYPVPINWHAAQPEVDYILSDSNAKALVGHTDLLAGLTLPKTLKAFAVQTPPEICDAYRIPEELTRSGRWETWDAFVEASAPYQGPSCDSPGVMIYTSGTTGKPKGVRRDPMSKAGAEAHLQRMAADYRMTPGEPATVLMNGPLYHSAPNLLARAAWAFGASIVLQPRFQAEELLSLIQEHRVTQMHIVPTMFHRLLSLPEDTRRKYDISSLVQVLHGAAPCPRAIKQKMIEWWGPIITEYYGATEVNVVTYASSEEFLKRPGTVGRVRPGVDVRIVGNNGQTLAPGETGEIYVRNTNIAKFTYHNAPTLRGAIERDGYVSVGDVGYFDEDGYLFLSDRKKDMIISGGVNIYPAEIEAAILALPGVKDCAVFGGPDEEFGECVIAHVEPIDESLNAQTIAEQLVTQLSKFKIPRIIKMVSSLPREDSGKIFKRKIRDEYWKGHDRKI